MNHPGPTYQLRSLFLTPHAPAILGMARAAVAAFRDMALAKRAPWGPVHEQPYARVALAQATALIDSARLYAISALEDIEATSAAGREISLEQRAQFRLSITHAHRAATEATNRIFEAAGTTAAVRLPSALERCFRDVHVANQHVVASPHTHEVVGGLLLGGTTPDPTY
jgi:indole-3-acetate monooxygenase